jgi:UDP-N-acetylmuramoyl-L-alanyl-D-glutamate--2,6-diaminopimelate ligase
MADDGITHVVAEVSSHAVDLRRIDDCDFDLGIFTNLSPEHLDYHQTMEFYYQAKKRFFAEVLPHSGKKHARKMVINADDEWGQRLLQEVDIPALAYGLDNACAVKAQKYEFSLSGIRATIDLQGGIISIASPLIGKFNLYNILAAAGAAVILQISPATIKEGIENLSCVPGRLEKVDTSFGSYVFVDYAHKADALTQVLQNLTGLKQRHIITVFGCGGNRDRGKRPLMGDAATTYSDFTIVTSDNPRLEEPLTIIAEIEAGIDKKKIKKAPAGPPQLYNDGHYYTIIPDRKKAIETAVSMAQTGDIVLIAGKGHEDYQIVGTTKLPFDDRVVAIHALKMRGV